MFLYKPEISLAEFDLGGVLYHANYFRVYEKAREAFLKIEEVPYSQLVKDGLHLAVVESSQRFLAPISYGQSIQLSLSVSELRRTTVTFAYSIQDEKNLLHNAWTKHALVKNSGEGFKPAKFPEKLLSALEKVRSK